MFTAMLLILVLPFQLFMIPLYVLIVRTYGLADSYLGMILPFAVNATAVFIFRQFFLQLPRELFESARIDGAGELTILRRIAIPLARPAIITRDDRHLHRALERVPVAVPDHQAARSAAARRGAGELHLDRRREGRESVRLDPRRGRRARHPGRRHLRGLPARVHPVEPRLGRQGMSEPQTGAVAMTLSERSDPWAPIAHPPAPPFVLERLGVVMTPLVAEPNEAWGVLNPATARIGTDL